MKISMAQFQPFKGDIPQNFIKHQQLIEIAITHKADLICFPELSLTGYEPQLAESLAMHEDDPVFAKFEPICDKNKITICVGFPFKTFARIHIAMMIIQPGLRREVYAKQFLHEDEKAFFSASQTQSYINIEGHKIAPAICYESLLPQHAEQVHKQGADIYLASVAKHSTGIQKAYEQYPKFAENYSMIVAMSNYIGMCDDFESAGGSAIWNPSGELVGSLDDQREGILVYDTKTHNLTKHFLTY